MFQVCVELVWRLVQWRPLPGWQRVYQQDGSGEGISKFCFVCNVNCNVRVCSEFVKVDLRLISDSIEIEILLQQ